jgi:multidrug efflux pump subunit AcrA (membrane-fusion protein)
LAFWKALLWTTCGASLLAVVALASFPIYQDYRARQSVQNSVTIGEARAHEMGIVLLEGTHPEGDTNVPAGAILNDRNGTFVFVEDLDLKNSFIRAAVSVVPNADDRTCVIRGLFPGDKIVVKGSRRLRNEPSFNSKTPGTYCS